MHIKYLGHGFLLFFLGLISVSAPLAAPAEKEYRLGIFPYLAPRQTIEFFGPVATSMGHALNHPVKLSTQPSFTDFTRAVDAQVYDIALINPFDFPSVVEKRGYLPLAQLSVPLVSQFYVRDDSTYRSLQDLRGTTIAMPPAESANARMTLRALYDNKLVPGQDVELHYFNSHDSCIQQVWSGSASACGTARPVIQVFEQRMQAKLRPIYDAPAIPHILFVAHPRVPPADRARLQQLIIGWSKTEEGQALLKNLGLPGFVMPKPEEYVVMRNYTKPAPVLATSKLNDNLVLGVFPYFAPRQLVENLAPLPAAFSKATGKHVNFKTASTFGSFMDGVKAGIYDIILVQPFDYAQAVQSGYLPLAAMKNPLTGAFFVREQSTLQALDDLKGQTISLPPTDSAQARLARHALSHADINPKRDITIRYRANHESCLRDVQRELAVACGTSPLVLNMLPKELTQGLRPISSPHSVPGVAFLAHQRIPQAIRNQLQTEILSWKDSDSGLVILNKLGFGEFSLLNPKNYDELSLSPMVRSHP